ANLAHGPHGPPGGDAKRPAWIALGPHGDLLPLRDGIDHLLVVDPGHDAVLGDPDTNAIPAVALELLQGARLVLRGVALVEAGQADDQTTPAADHQRAMRVADGKRRGAEEVVAGDALPFQGDFVIAAREIAARVRDARHVVAPVHDDNAIFHFDLALAAEVGRLPAHERLAVEKRLPAGLILLGFRGRFLVPLAGLLNGPGCTR